MIANETQQNIISPALLDAAFAQVQAKLLSGLSWLDFAFGKAQRLERQREGQTIRYPGVFGSKDYINMFPDSHLGNFCFFDVPDAQVIEDWRRGHFNRFHTGFGLVFWVDLRDVYPADYTRRTTEHVKEEVLRFFATTSFAGCRVEPTEIDERTENIYPGYTIAEIDNQFLMRPYAGFRMSGVITYDEACTP